MSSAMETDSELVNKPSKTSPHIKQFIDLCQNADHTQNSTKIVKQIPLFRHQLDKALLVKMANDSGASTALVKFAEGGSSSDTLSSSSVLMDAAMGLVTQIFLYDNDSVQHGFELSRLLLRFLKTANSRKLDAIASKIYFYFTLFATKLNVPSAELVPTLLSSHRTATLRHDQLSSSVLITATLATYLRDNDISSADRLIAKTTFPTTAANGTIARYLYYLGRIRAIQLDYTSASEHLLTSIRKIDPSPNTAGFLQAVTKLNIIVQLLIGELPDRAELRSKYVELSLRPYLALVNAVRIGDLAQFSQVVKEHGQLFKKDATFSLISRLRNNVLKTGIRGISLSYSKISLRDICQKLGLESEESAEYIVSKCIRDRVITGTLNHDRGYLVSIPSESSYLKSAGKEFDERIRFCLELRNESVRNMRYRDDEGRAEIREMGEEEERRRVEVALEGFDDSDEI